METNSLNPYTSCIYSTPVIRFILIALLSLTLYASELKAQNFRLAGQVLDISTGKPIENAVIKIGESVSISDKDGKFSFMNLKAGIYELRISQKNYNKIIQAVKLTGSYKFLKFELIPLSLHNDNQLSENRDQNEENLYGLNEVDDKIIENDEINTSQYIPLPLNATRDIYIDNASYNFNDIYFKIRGYDYKYITNSINNFAFQNIEENTHISNSIYHLSRAATDEETVYGLNYTKFHSGILGESSNIILSPIQLPGQLKVSYALSDAAYDNKISVMYATGLLKNGYAFTFGGQRAWAEQSYVQGTFTDTWHYFFSGEKKLNTKNSLAFNLSGSPTSKALRSAATQEVYELAGNYYYNSYWGYQYGQVRNSKVEKYHTPISMLTENFDNKENLKIRTNLVYVTGKTSQSELEWYNAPDPRPDYYKYLPSYATDSLSKSIITKDWKNDANVRQIDWDKLYQANYLANLEGQPANYILEDRITKFNMYGISSDADYKINDNINLYSGLQASEYISVNYKQIEDMLGGNYWLDRDQYAQQTSTGDSLKPVNDLNNPNAKLTQGDEFGYKYKDYISNLYLWSTADFDYNRLNFFITLYTSTEQYYRDGLMRNGRYPDDSYGNSNIYRFYDYGEKAGMLYKISGRNYLGLNTGYFTLPPAMADIFINPTISNETIDHPQNENIFSAELNYIHKSKLCNIKISVYNTVFTNVTESNSFYDDEYETFVYQNLTGINRINRGIEAATEIPLTSNFSVVLSGSLSDYRYTSRPNSYISYENGVKSDTSETIYCRNFYVSGAPQTVYSIGLNYFYKYWYVNFNLNYFDRDYMDFFTERRTTLAVEGLGPGNPLIPQIVDQEKLPADYILNASIGKSLLIKKHNAFIYFSMKNLLNNKSIAATGFEQSRFDYETQNVNEFPPKYIYSFGRTFSLV